MLDSLIKSVKKEYDFEINNPKFLITDPNKPKKVTVTIREYTDPPIVVKQPLYRTHSDKYDDKNENPIEEYQPNIEKDKTVFRKSKSESKEDKELVKQDSKENKRDWLKKQLSVNHHYLKDLKMPLNSISHRNAMLNIGRYRLKASSCPDIFKNSMITIDETEEVSILTLHNIKLFICVSIQCYLHTNLLKSGDPKKNNISSHILIDVVFRG